MKKKFWLHFLAISAAIVAIFTTTLLIISDKTLARAGKECDTISIVATFNEVTKTLTATQTIDYKNRTGQTLNEVRFHIYANAYRKDAINPPVAPNEPQAYPNGKSFGGIAVHSVKVGSLVEHKISGADGTVLIVPVNGFKAGSVARIVMDYTITLANIKHRLGFTNDAINLANFYPVPVVFENGSWQEYPYSHNGDPFYNDVFNFDVKLTAPKNLVIASSGTEIKPRHFKSTAIRDFAIVMSKNFQILHKNMGGIAVNYFYLNDNSPQKSLEVACNAVKTFSNLFTKYPYRQLSVVQTDFLHGGMEYGELVYIARDMLKNQAERSEHEYVIVHEIAHQWWYGVVGNNQSSTAWIDEGLAEYSSMLYYDYNPDPNFKRAEMIKNSRASYNSYLKIIKGLGIQTDATMNRDLNDFVTPMEYVYMTYVRGFLLFCDLEDLLSRDALLKSLKEFSHNTMFKTASQKALVNTIEQTTKRKVGLFFDTYLVGINLF